MKPLLIIMLLTAIGIASTAQDTIDETMYQAYLHQDKILWKKAVEERAKEAKQSPSDANKQFKLAFAQFSLLSSTMATKDEALFDEYLDTEKELLKSLINNPKTAPEAKALLSATYGLQMGYSPMKGITLGSKSSSLAEEAKTLAPTSAIAWRMYGGSKYYTPSAFGGDAKEAITALEKSIHYFEKKPEQLKSNWLYIDTIALLGQAYLKNAEKAKAIATYEKAIGVEPSFAYAKSLLAKTKK
jgi:tetratricopeptide (TPR) repeat protein